MATLSNSQRLREARKKREEESKNSSSQSASRNYRNSEILEMRKLERNIGLDTFESDLTSMGTTLQGIYSDWQTPETMTNTRASVESMMNRINDFQTYQSKYGNADASNISEIASGYQSVLADWDKLSEAYGYYQNADAFNTARKKAQYDEQFSGLSYDDVQKKKKEYAEDSDEYKYLSEYTNYSDLRDFDMALTSAKTNLNVTRSAINPNAPKKDNKFDAIEKAVKNTPSVANGSAIAYNPGEKSSQSDYIKELETLRNQYALDHQFDLYKDYMNAEDFEEKSQYKTTVEDRKFLWMDDRYIGDEVYEYINNPEIRSDLLGDYYTRQSQTQGFALYEPPKYAEMGLDMLTEEEIKVYNYLHDRSEEEANKFLEDMKVTLTKRASDKKDAMIKEEVDDSVLASIGLSLVSPILNVGGSIYSGIDTVSSALKGEASNPYSPYHSLVNESSTIRKEVGENIAESTEGWELFGQNIPSFLYQTGMSVGDTLVGGKSFGSAYTMLMGMSSAQQTAKDLTEAGATEEQIMKGSIASGLIEVVTEKVSFDHWVKAKNADSLLKIIKEAAKQAGIEGSEELFAEVANIAFDKLNRGEDSDVNKMYEEYISRGFSEEEAEKMVMQDIAKQIGFAFAGGAISGGVLGSTSSMRSHHDLSNTGKAIKSNDRVQEMMDMIDLMKMQGLTPEQSEALRSYAKYAQKGMDADTISNAQLGNLYRTSEREAIDTIKSKKSTDTQKSDAMKRLDSLDVIATSKPVDERARQQRVESLNRGEVTEVTSTGNSTKIEGIRIDNGDTIVLTSEGEVKAEDMTFSYNDAEILSYAENMSEEKANLLLSQYDGKADADSYVKSFNLAYAYGETGFGAESVLKNKGVLSESQASAIYKNAVLNRTNEQQKAIDEIATKHGKTTILKGKFDDSIIDYSGKSNNGSKVNWKKLDSRQRNAVVFAKAFSKATGVNITFVTSKEVVDEDGNKTRIGKNGSYNPNTNTIEIDVYAGIDAEHANDSIIPTLSHEVTHWMKAKAPAMYSKMTEYIGETIVADGRTTMDNLVDDRMNRMKEAHPEMNVTAEMAIDEIVARACEDMLSNSDTARKLLNRMSESEKKSFIKKVKDTFNNLISWVNDLLGQYKSESAEAKVLRQYKERLKQLSKMWDKALMEAVQTNQSLQKEGITGEEAINAITEKVGITVDMETESAAPSEQFSERTWTESEYVQNRKVAISNLAMALGVSEKKAEKYVDAINSVARLIADDRARLDYDSNIDENATVFKPNSDYKWSIDMSTLCAKRLLFTGTFDEIQKRLPNTALDSDDIVKIRKMMMDKGYQVACGICYVESTRREIGTITKDFIERYKIAQKTGKPIARVNSSGKEVDLVESGTKAKFYAEKGYTPTLAELNTTDIDLVKRDHPSVYGAYLSFMNARGQAKPKLLETRAEYKGEIASKFKRKKNGELNASTISMNESGGLRLQSFSDFEIAHLIDMMQVVMDMSEVGLMSQAYTKVPEFAEVFGDTGVKINLSLIAKGSGLDENGELIFDDVEGIDHKKAFALREKFSKNVGTILVGKNDAHIIKAMADSRIDYIIPFHKSSWRESLYDALGLTGYDDYTDTQHEKSINPNRKIKDFMPSEYWDFTKSGDENAQIYLEKCKADGRIPKFPQFAQYDGYWKLLIDFKMYDNNGVGSPQTQVMPNFNMKAANRILNEYEGGHRSFPVAKDIVDEFVAEYKKEHAQEQYSDREVRTLTDEDYKSAKEHFGTTTNFNVAGYMLKDGAMLDFSGKHWGDTTSRNRQVDHRDIEEVISYGNSGLDSMVNMISNGNIRLMPENGGINLAIAPTSDQLRVLERYINNFRGEVVVDIDKVGGDTIKSFTYDRGTSAKKILDDIDNYFRGGRRSELMMFHTQYSDRDSDGNQLTDAQQEFFKDSKVRDADGNLMVMYHGSPFKFTVFEDKAPINGRVSGDGFYFTESKKEASYWGKNGKNYKTYLNITNPFVVSTTETTPEAVMEVLKKRTGEVYDKLSSDSKWWGNKYTRDEYIRNEAERYADTDKAFTSLENKTETLKALGYDGVIVMNKSKSSARKDFRYTEVVAFYPNQIKLTTNKKPSDVSDMRYSDRESAIDWLISSIDDYLDDLSIEDLLDVVSDDSNTNDETPKTERAKRRVDEVNKRLKAIGLSFNGTKSLVWTDERIDKYLSGGYYGSSNPNYAQAYITYMTPQQFLNLTVGSKLHTVDMIQNESEAYGEVDIEKLGNSSPIFLDIEEGRVWTKVTGHEGRHRMYLLGKAGFDKVPVLLFDYRTKYDKTAKDEMKLIAQRYNDTELVSKSRNVVINDVIPFSNANRDLIVERFGSGNENADIRYADRTLTRAEANQLARQKVASYKEQIEKKAKIESITQKALVLEKWLNNPTNKEHVNDAMVPVVGHLVKAINFSSKQYLGMRGGKWKGMPTKTDLSLAQAFADIQQMVTKAEVDNDVLFELYGADLDEDMDALVKSVNLYMRTVGDNEFVLNQMTLDELHRFDKIVGAIKSSVSKMNRFHVANTTKTIAEITHQDINHFNSLGKAKLHKGKFASNVSQMLNWGNATPYYAFKRFGEGGMKVYEALQDGWDKFAFHIKKIIDYAEGTYSSEDVKKWSEEVHEFDVLMPATEEQLNDPKFKGNHKKIQMTTAQIMSLYCLQKREQAKKHLRGGGIRIANFTTKDGVVEQAEGVVLMDKEVDKIINVLTLEQIAVANRLQKFMNEECVDWGNEISMKRFGYKAFGEENYFPIKSDDNVTGTGEVKEKEKSLYRLLNLSFTKSLVKEANNRIVVDNIFDVFAQHTSEMAKYNALALPVLDAVRWFNYKEKGKKVDTHFETRSLKAAMESAFGKDANNYVATFLQDINGADNVGRDRIAKGFMKNAKIASVGFNAKVVALQPTSYLRASAVIDNKYLVKALSKKPKMAMAEKWCGMAQWKALGFIDINVQRGVAELIKHEESAMDKMTELAMKGAEIADKVTLGYLWNACEAEIKDKNPGLAVGSEAFNKAVGKRLRDIIYATQVVDSTMTRSHMMRSSDTKDKILTNFASEPTLSYNMLMDAYYDYKLTERQTGSRSKAFSKNGKKLARTMYAYTITCAITALLELGFELFRDDEEMSPEDIMKAYLENLYLNMSVVNKIPYAKEAISILQGFTSNSMDTQWMQYFSYAAKGLVKLFSGEGNAYKTLQNTIKAFSYGFGIPIQNLTRDINALMDKLGILTSDDLEDMFNDTIGEAFPSLKTEK